MTILKPALCAAALVAAVAVAIPAIAQQTPQGAPPSATQPAPQAAPDGRPDWRGGPRGRYSDEDGPRWRRRDEGRRYGDDGPRRWHERRFGGRDGMMPPMMERGAMMRPFGMAHACGPEGARIGEMMMDRVERATQPTTEQRPGFDRLKEAAGKAGEIMRDACTTERPVTPTGRLANAEKRLSAMLDAVRTIRPAMDAYYGTLTDEQKARLTLAQPHMGRPGMGGGWRERMHRRHERMRNNDEPRGDRTENAQPGDDSEKL